MATPVTAKPARPLERPAGWWCYPLTWALIAWAAPMLTDQLTWWWLPALAAAVGVLGAALVRVVWPRVVYGDGFTTHAAVFALVVGAASGYWLLRVRAVGDQLVVWQVWLIISAVLAGWWVLLVLRAPAAAAAMDARRDLPPGPDAEPDPLGGVFYDILREAGVVPACQIVDVVASPSGGVQSVHLRAVRRPGKQVMTFDMLRGKLATIAAQADLWIDGADIDEQDVTPEKVTSSRYIVHFTVKRVLEGAEFEYPIRTEPRPVGNPLNLGKYETDKALELALFTEEHGASHLDLVAGTGGSKTTCMHCLIAEDNASDRWEVWLFASQKLTHLAWPWLRPWLEGKTDRPPVDAVFGQSQDRILIGLSWALQLAAGWNSATDAVREVTPGRAGLTVAIDESSDCLRNAKKITFRVGAEMVTMNASEIVAKLAEIARTSPVKVVRASQYGLFDSAGSAGAESRRNVLAAIVGKVTRASDANNVAPGMPPGWDATKLRDYAIFVQPNLEEPTVLRAKAWALFKDRVDPVAIAYARWRNGLDPAATAALTRGPDGSTYDQRWAPEHHRELVAFAAAKGLRWRAPGGPAVEQTTLPETPATPATPDHQEEPVPTPPADDLPPLPDDWPAEWSREDFDVFAAITGEAPEQAEPQDVDQMTTTSGSVLANADTSGIRAGFRAWERDRGRVRKMARLPEPLGRILAHMMHPRARRIVETGWVPTVVLAQSLGRLDGDADDKARQRAIAQLGLEIGKITGLRSQEIPRPVLAQLEMDRASGWRVDELRAVGDRLMDALPDEPPAG